MAASRNKKREALVVVGFLLAVAACWAVFHHFLPDNESVHLPYQDF